MNTPTHKSSVPAVALLAAASLIGALLVLLAAVFAAFPEGGDSQGDDRIARLIPGYSEQYQP